ncbi:hypothetical protein MTO96_000812 [Rhipicephalus appendiculatus]
MLLRRGPTGTRVHSFAPVLLEFSESASGNGFSLNCSVSKPSKAVQFRERWDATDVIRDVEHIKEDLATLVDMQSSGEMTDEEITFYFFRMHDFRRQYDAGWH